ncbi:MAG: hypothetical protein F6J87_02235 [Spirulina sp. SIO3F2]|nr:hypothetical protein [Spirulina sp. SIO3F2]
MNRVQPKHWFNRETITLLTGLFLLVLGSIFPWYQLPPESLEIFDTNLLLAKIARVLTALLAIWTLVLALFSGISRLPRFPFWVGFIVVLLFPYFITTWSPTVSYLTESYFEQGRTVSSQIERKYSQIQAQWKQNLVISESKPTQSTFYFSISDSRFFQMPSWEQVFLDGFGYRNSFFAFIGKGWSLTAIALVMILMGLYLKITSPGLCFFLQDMKWLVPGVSLLLVIIVFQIISANIVNHKLDTLFAKGQYQQVISLSQTIESWYPPLKGDEVFLRRLAESGFYSDEPEPALVDFVKGLERYRVGDFNKAQSYFQQSLELQPNRFLVRGYLTSALINEAVEYSQYSDGPKLPVASSALPYRANFLDSSQAQERPNSKRPNRTAELLEKALEVFPSNIEVLYDLMLTQAINGKFSQSAEIAQQLIELQQYSQQPNISLLGQAYLHLSWRDYRNGDVKQAWKRYRQSIDPRVWNPTRNSSQ